MFKFEAAYILYFLILIPIGIVLIWLTLQWKGNVLDKVGDRQVIARLFPDWSVQKEWLKAGLLLCALALLLVSWSNPQWGTRAQKVKAKSTDVIIALDISQSMLAEDISPNRMERAKRFCTELLKRLKGERVGLIFFAGSAYLQMPLSQDFASAELYIKAASPNQAGTQGTVIADAIKMSGTIFNDEKASQKALIIISDGENHESEAIVAAGESLSNGTHVYTLGIGSEEGAPVPFYQNNQVTYKKDKNGNVINSIINTSLLQEIADSGGGQFYMIDQVMSALDKLDKEIDKLEKIEVEQRSFTDYNSYFQYFLFPAIFLLFLEYIIVARSGKSGDWKKALGLNK